MIKRTSPATIIVLLWALMLSQAPAMASPKAAAMELQNAFIEVSEMVTPSVVNISTKQKAGAGLGNSFEMPFGEQIPEDFKDFFDFFDDMPDREQESLGSGFVIDPDGYIITNAHVIENADTVTVTLADEEQFEAEIIGSDKNTDVALLKINAGRSLAALKFADSEQVKVGMWVVAIGNPFGLERTITAGIISAKGRSIGQGNYDDFLQTDAAINPGNSGGPLVNLDGDVVGVNTAIFSRNGGNMGIGFAIPANLAMYIYGQLREHGKWVRGWLGVYIQDMDEKLAAQFGLKDTKGVLITEIIADSPASAAGVKSGDVIIEFNGKKVDNMKELMKVVAFTPIGTKVNISVMRDNKKLSLRIEVGERPEDDKIAEKGPVDKEERTDDILGVTVQDIDKDIAEKLGVDPGKGVLVTQIKRGSPASKSGIAPGDIIREIDRKPVANVAEYKKISKNFKSGDDVLLFIIRSGHSMFQVVTLAEDDEK